MATDTIVEQILSTKVRDDLDAVIEHAQETKQPIVVMRGDKEAVIIIDALQYRQDQEKIAYLQGIIAGLNDVLDGKVVGTEEVEARLDAILAE